MTDGVVQDSPVQVRPIVAMRVVSIDSCNNMCANSGVKSGRSVFSSGGGRPLPPCGSPLAVNPLGSLRPCTLPHLPHCPHPPPSLPYYQWPRGNPATGTYLLWGSPAASSPCVPPPSFASAAVAPAFSPPPPGPLGGSGLLSTW